MKLVLFDFDGTISDSHEAAFETFNSLSGKFGYRKVLSHEMSDIRDKTSQEVVKYLGISRLKLPLVLRAARIRFQDQIEGLKPFKGIQASLEKLRGNGYKLGILTSNSRKNVDSFLSVNRLDCFDFIHSGASLFGKGKIIRNVLKKRKFRAQEAVYVGDETRDIEAAQSAGIRIISVSWGFNTRRVLLKGNPDVLIDNPSELFVTLRKLE